MRLCEQRCQTSTQHLTLHMRMEIAHRSEDGHTTIAQNLHHEDTVLRMQMHDLLRESEGIQIPEDGHGHPAEVIEKMTITEEDIAEVAVEEEVIRETRVEIVIDHHTPHPLLTPRPSLENHYN